MIPELDPDVIVAVDYDSAYENIDNDTTQSAKDLIGDDRKLVLVEDTPNSTIDPRACLSKAKVVEECRFVANTTPTPLEARYRLIDERIRRSSRPTSTAAVCPFLPICDPIVDGQIVRVDFTHITGGFAESIAPQVTEYLEQTVLGTDR